MKKYLGLLLAMVCLLGIKNVDAANTYRQNANGDYTFCVDDNCENVSAGSDFGTMSGDNIIRNGVVYSKDSGVSEDSEEETSKPSSFGDKSPCARLKSPLKFIGYILLIVKIIIPLLLIVFGIIDLFKAVTGGKDGEITKSLKTFIFRLIAGIAIFFIPTIISFVFTLVDGFDDVESDYNICQKCILNVSECK